MFTTGGSFAAGATNAIGNYGSSLGSWASSYNSMAALSQLGSAISMTGQQQGWDVSTTTFVSFCGSRSSWRRFKILREL